MIFLLIFNIPIFILSGYYFGGYWNFLSLFILLIIEPILDLFFGENLRNRSKSEAESFAKKKIYQWILYLWAFVQYALLFFAFYVVLYGNLSGLLEYLAFIGSIVIGTGAIGITVAHDLGHKRSKFDRFLSKAILMTVSYMHFYIEHNRGHHVTVGTEEDPATARLNENLYMFLWRSIWTGYVHAWKIENERCRRNYGTMFHWKNEMIIFAILPILFISIVTLIFSFNVGTFVWEIPLFFYLQSASAISLLESINYIEHYGLLREKKENGKYEKVSAKHSWNANHILSNALLINLQRHSDHHLFPAKVYQNLDQYKESPQLAFGYPTLIWIAHIPPLWFRIMNKRLEEFKTASL